MKPNTKTVPIIITLAAALISCVASIAQGVEFSVFVTRLFIVVAIFIVLGTIIKIVLDYAFKTLEPTVPIDEEASTVVPEEDEGQQVDEINTTEDNTSDTEEG